MCGFIMTSEKQFRRDVFHDFLEFRSFKSAHGPKSNQGQFQTSIEGATDIFRTFRKAIDL